MDTEQRSQPIRSGSLRARLFCAILVATILPACSEDPIANGRQTDNANDDDDKTDDEDEPAPDDEDDDESPPATTKDAGKTPAKVDAGRDSGATTGQLDAGASTTPPAKDASAKDSTSPVEQGDTGTVSADGAVTPPKEHEDLGKGDGKDVITIGDSWMEYIINGGGIERGLKDASKQPYRNYGAAATQLLNGQIPSQYATAKRANPDIKTVVMTGGGNDILLTGASPPAQIEKVGKRLDELWTEMGKDGVQDVVYIEYSEGGSADNAKNVQMGIAKVQPICDNHKAVRCHFMLSDPVINKMLLDGIHPTQDGCTKLGKAAFDLMVSEGMRR